MMKTLNPRFPWRRINIVISVLILLAIIFNLAHDAALNYFVPVQYRRMVEWGLVLVWCVSGAWVIRILNHFVLHKSLERSLNHRTAVLISRLLTGIGAVFILLVALNLLQIRLSSLLVGGAVTGVVVGIGAQSTFSNLFAGLILLTLRPFTVGQYVTLRTSLFSGIEYGGYVSEMNWFYTVLIDGDQKRVLPNSSVIVSAVTVSSKDKIASYVFTIPLPYSVSEKDLGEALLARTNGETTIKIREFAKESYTVEIHLPADIDLGVVRESIATFQNSNGN